MAKALKEAKMNTSWIQPNEAWDAAMHDFVARVLDPSPENNFSRASFRSRKRSRGSARSTRSRRSLLKLTVPGVPDIYQGNEIWDFSLVDPDNRRPVDYVHRQQMLDALEGTYAGRVAAKTGRRANQDYS